MTLIPKTPDHLICRKYEPSVPGRMTTVSRMHTIRGIYHGAMQNPSTAVPMTGAVRAAACPPEAASRIAHHAVRSPGTRGPTMGRLGLGAYSWAACEDFGAWSGLAIAACGCWELPRASRLGWSRPLHSRCPGWVRVHSDKPVSIRVSDTQESETSCNSVRHIPGSDSCPQLW